VNDGFGVDISLLPGQVHHTMTDWFTGVLVTGLAAGLIILSGRRARARALSEANRHGSEEGPDSDKPSPVPFGSPAMAAIASAHENTVFWQQLLAAFASTIEAEGYTFGTDARAKVALPYATRERAGAAIVRARCRIITPLRSEAELKTFLRDAAEDGYACSWADWCQQGAEAAGWYVTRSEMSRTAENATTG
jgi:hypothetical protein